jgi:hypothetical protein
MGAAQSALCWSSLMLPQLEEAAGSSSKWPLAVGGCEPPTDLFAFPYMLPNWSKEERDLHSYTSQESSQGLPEVLVTLKTDLSSHTWTCIALEPC